MTIIEHIELLERQLVSLPKDYRANAQAKIMELKRKLRTGEILPGDEV